MPGLPDTFFLLRATRSTPPGHAQRDERRATYGTALAQFEELIEAARRVGTHTRALPLFYALSQAGRAIAAMTLDEPWQLQGHGLTCPDLATESILHTRVHLARVGRRGRDSFRGVSLATGSQLPHAPMSIGALWAALPDVSRLLDGVRDADEFRRPLLLMPEGPEDSPAPILWTWNPLRCKVTGLNPAATADTLREHLSGYPHGDTFAFDGPETLTPLFEHTADGIALRASWAVTPPTGPGYWSTLERIAPTAPGTDERWWRPQVAGAVLRDLMAWWALLFALSMLTRYEPAGWNAALDLNKSDLAAPLRRLLDAGVETIPDLILEILQISYQIG